MKKFLYVFIGMAIALGAVVLYSFKAKENAEVSYATIIGAESNWVEIYYDDGQKEDAETLLGVKIRAKKDNGQMPFGSVVSKTLKHMSDKGYRVIGYSVSSPGTSFGFYHYYTLIKEN
jgi:hypothetical protein